MPTTLFGMILNHLTGGGVILRSGSGTMIWFALMMGNPPGSVERWEGG